MAVLVKLGIAIIGLSVTSIAAMGIHDLSVASATRGKGKGKKKTKESKNSQGGQQSHSDGQVQTK